MRRLAIALAVVIGTALMILLLLRLQASVDSMVGMVRTDGPQQESLPLKATPPGSAGIEWIPVSGGSYMMGREDGSADERPVHRVTIDAFELARTPTTVDEYKHCVNAGACREPDSGPMCNYHKNDRPDHPVNCLTWLQAVEFCGWIGGRLPTEAEWERAARAESGSLYPWGDEAPSCKRAVIRDPEIGCGVRGTWPVCSKPAGNSPSGICDLLGNVWQWCSDYYGKHYYEKSPTNDPKGEESGESKSLRGACFANTPRFVSASERDRQGPEIASTIVGFRCARDIGKRNSEKAETR